MRKTIDNSTLQEWRERCQYHDRNGYCMGAINIHGEPCSAITGCMRKKNWSNKHHLNTIQL